MLYPRVAGGRLQGRRTVRVLLNNTVGQAYHYQPLGRRRSQSCIVEKAHVESGFKAGAHGIQALGAWTPATQNLHSRCLEKVYSAHHVSTNIAPREQYYEPTEASQPAIKIYWEQT